MLRHWVTLAGKRIVRKNAVETETRTGKIGEWLGNGSLVVEDVVELINRKNEWIQTLALRPKKYAFYYFMYSQPTVSRQMFHCRKITKRASSKYLNIVEPRMGWFVGEPRHHYTNQSDARSLENA